MFKLNFNYQHMGIEFRHLDGGVLEREDTATGTTTYYRWKWDSDKGELRWIDPAIENDQWSSYPTFVQDLYKKHLELKVAREIVND